MRDLRIQPIGFSKPGWHLVCSRQCGLRVLIYLILTGIGNPILWMRKLRYKDQYLDQEPLLSIDLYLEKEKPD